MYCYEIASKETRETGQIMIGICTSSDVTEITMSITQWISGD
ncbi:hypothetical protein [Vulcanisaeta sp. JCM 16159]